MFPYTGYYEPQSLHDSGAETATGTGSLVYKPPKCEAVICVLDVSAAATDSGDTLDVVIQANLRAEWVDVLAFDQVLGDGGAKTYVYKLIANAALTGFETGSSLSAGSKRDIIAPFRCKWTIADVGGDDASFTFSVDCIPI